MLIDEPPESVWPEMPRLDFLRIAAHIRWTADQMNLRDWTLQLKWEPADIGEEKFSCYAKIEVMDTKPIANIWVCDGFVHIPPEEQHRAIVHELVHIHLDRLASIGDEQCKSYLGLVGYEMLGSEMHRAIEQVTEAIASSWSRTLDPIPDKLTAEDDIVIRLRDGNEFAIGDYLKGLSDASGVQPVE